MTKTPTTDPAIMCELECDIIASTIAVHRANEELYPDSCIAGSYLNALAGHIATIMGFKNMNEVLGTQFGEYHDEEARR